MRIAPHRGAWGGHYNGVGGHIERGEHPANAAVRELQEESGITPESIRLCGVVIIETRRIPGIGLYVFMGQSGAEPARQSEEGVATWVPLDMLPSLPLVEDLPQLIPAAMAAYQGGPAFTARYTYDERNQLQIDLES